MRGQAVPESIGIHIGRNPEYIGEAELMQVAEKVALEAAERLTGGRRD